MQWVDKSEAILEGLGYPYDFERFECDQSQPISGQLPDRYIVYFLVSDQGKGYADGAETSHEPRVQVSFYYRNKPDFLTIPDQIDSAFSSNGFTLGPSGSIPFQPDTGHYGWRRDLYFYERR